MTSGRIRPQRSRSNWRIEGHELVGSFAPEEHEAKGVCQIIWVILTPERGKGRRSLKA
jgi:hypothetical protein